MDYSENGQSCTLKCSYLQNFNKRPTKHCVSKWWLWAELWQQTKSVFLRVCLDILQTLDL